MALVVVVLGGQERRGEEQVVRARSSVDLTLPVVPAATSVAQITIAVVVVAPADEG